jgi:hypothetical protein
VTKAKRDHATKHCDDFNKTVTFILDVTKETGFPLSYILAYERCGRYWTHSGVEHCSSQQCNLQHLELHHTVQEGTLEETELSCLREVIEFGKTEAIALIHCSVYFICYQI